MKKHLLLLIIIASFNSCKKWNGGSTISVTVKFLYMTNQSPAQTDSIVTGKGAGITLTTVEGVFVETTNCDNEGKCKLTGLKKDGYVVTAWAVLKGKQCSSYPETLYVHGTPRTSQNAYLNVEHQ